MPAGRPKSPLTLLGKPLDPDVSAAIEKKLERKTIKQRLWLQQYIGSGDGTQAAYDIYNCKDRIVAAQIAANNRKAIGISEILELLGLTDIQLGQKLIEGLNATFHNEPAYNVRHKYLETAFKVKGHMTPEQHVNNDNGIHINVGVFAPSQTIIEASTHTKAKKSPVMQAEIVE